MNKIQHSVVILSLVLGILYFSLLSDKGGIKEYRTNKDYANVMTHLQQGLLDKGYEIEKVQPIDNGLAKAGLKIKAYKVIFFNPRYTLDAIEHKYPGFSALLPLSITVAQEKGSIKIVSTPFKFLTNAAHGKDLRALIKLWELHSDNIIKKALKESEAVFKLGSL